MPGYEQVSRFAALSAVGGGADASLRPVGGSLDAPMGLMGAMGLMWSMGCHPGLGAEGGADVVGEDYHRDGGGGCNLGNGAQRDYR